MKVGFCAHDGKGELGGVATWIGDLLPVLKAKGIETQALMFVRDGSETPLINRLRLHGVPVATQSHFAPFKQRIEWLTSVIQQDQIQVLIPNYFLTGFCAARWLRSEGLKSVAVLHSDDPTYHRILTEMKQDGSDFPVDRVVAVSQKLYSHAVTVFPSERVSQIPYGIPLPEGTATPPDKVLRIVYTGRISQYQKRILDTVRAVCRACRQYPQISADFYGDGSELEACREIVRAEQLEDRIRFMGACHVDKLRQVLPDYHSIVLLSDFEGLPVALLEGMFAGLVPICSRIESGIPELVKDGESGMLVDDREHGLVEAIGKLLNREGWWSHLSLGARRAVQDYSLEHCVAKWEQVLCSLDMNTPVASHQRSSNRRSLPKHYSGFEWDDMRRPFWDSWIYRPLRGLKNRLYLLTGHFPEQRRS